MSESHGVTEQEDDPASVGDRLRREIMGDEWVDAAPGGDGDALAQFSSMARKHVWQAFWPRPGLELRMRSAATICALVSLEANQELIAHVRGALRMGLLSKTEIRELVLHLTPYLGYPRIRHALGSINDELLVHSDDLGHARRHGQPNQ